MWVDFINMYTHIFTVFIRLFFLSCSLSVCLSLSLSLSLSPAHLSSLFLRSVNYWSVRRLCGSQFVNVCVCVFALSAKDSMYNRHGHAHTKSHDSLMLLCWQHAFIPQTLSLSLSLAFHTHSVGFIRNTTRPFSFTPRLCCRNDRKRLLQLAEYIYTYISWKTSSKKKSVWFVRQEGSVRLCVYKCWCYKHISAGALDVVQAEIWCRWMFPSHKPQGSVYWEKESVCKCFSPAVCQ